jgi:hypothetical protein
VSTDTVAVYAPQATVVVRNLTSSVLVIASDPKRTHEVNFEAKGAPDGGDYQHMPPEIIATPAFARQISLGTLEVVQGADSPVVQQAMRAQGSKFWAQQDKDRDAALATIDREPDRDFQVLKCVGPGTRAGSPCGTDIPLRVTELATAVPLCTAHEHLKDRAVRRGSGDWQIEGQA